MIVSNVFHLLAAEEAAPTRENLLYCTLFQQNRISRWSSMGNPYTSYSGIQTGDDGIDGYNAFQMRSLESLTTVNRSADLIQKLYSGSTSFMKPSTWYTLSFRSMGNLRDSYNNVVSGSAKMIVLIQSCIDISEDMIVDGTHVAALATGYVEIPLMWEPKVHTITFKTLSVFSNVTSQALRFRSAGKGNSVYPSISSGGTPLFRVACVKLEEGNSATAYVPHTTETLQPISVTAYTRSNSSSVSAPTGGTYSNPVPSTSGWSLSVPSGSAMLWASMAVFYPEATSSPIWSTPSSMTDTSTLDVEFSPDESKPSAPTASTLAPSGQSEIVKGYWYDTIRNPKADFTKMVWRAERICTNGTWSEWAINKCNGQDGSASVGYTIEIVRGLCKVKKNNMISVDIAFKVKKSVGDSSSYLHYDTDCSVQLKPSNLDDKWWNSAGDDGDETFDDDSIFNQIYGIGANITFDDICKDPDDQSTNIGEPNGIGIRVVSSRGVVLCTSFVQFVRDGQDGISADPASVYDISCNTQSLPCDKDSVLKRAITISVTGRERDANGNFSPMADLKCYFVHNYTQSGVTRSSTVPVTASGGVASSTISPNSMSIKNIENYVWIKCYKVKGDGSELLIKDFYIYPLCDGNEGQPGDTGKALTIHATRPTIGCTLANVTYGSVSSNETGNVSLVSVEYGDETSEDSSYQICKDDGTWVDSVKGTISTMYYLGWEIHHTVMNGKMTVLVSGVLSNRPIYDSNGNPNNNIVICIPVRGKHPSASGKWIEMNITVFAVVRGLTGAVGRSYRPNIIGVWDAQENYVWNDAQRDGVVWKKKGSTTDYCYYFVSEYGMSFSGADKEPGVETGGYWDTGTEYKLILSNLIVSDNAVIGGFTMAGGLLESVRKINGTSILKIDGINASIALKKGNAGIEMGLGKDDDDMPYLRGLNTNGDVIWNLGQKAFINFNSDVLLTITSVTAEYREANGDTKGRYSAKVNVSVKNNTNGILTFTGSVNTGVSVDIYNPAYKYTSSKYLSMSSSSSITLAVGDIGNMTFTASYITDEYYLPVEGTSIPVRAYYIGEMKDTANGSLVVT